MRTFATCAIVLLGCGAAAAQQPCPPKQTDLVQPPVLSGVVADAARNVFFEWTSTAQPIGGAWRITHSVCNTGRSPLILSWPKTGIVATALMSIPSGNPIIVSHTVGDEPVIDGSPIRYGFAYSTDASSYQKKETFKRLTKLISSVSGVVELQSFGGLVSSRRQQRLWDVQMIFEVDRHEDGYKFRIAESNKTSTRLLIGISALNSALFFEAYKSAGLKPDVLVVDTGSVSTKNGKRILARYIVVPVSELIRIDGVVIPNFGITTDVANVALIDDQNKIVMRANVSLFQ